jgi:hypothetical protein
LRATKKIGAHYFNTETVRDKPRAKKKRRKHVVRSIRRKDEASETLALRPISRTPRIDDLLPIGGIKVILVVVQAVQRNTVADSRRVDVPGDSLFRVLPGGVALRNGGGVEVVARPRVV